MHTLYMLHMLYVVHMWPQTQDREGSQTAALLLFNGFYLYKRGNTADIPTDATKKKKKNLKTVFHIVIYILKSTSNNINNI